MSWLERLLAAAMGATTPYSLRWDIWAQALPCRITTERTSQLSQVLLLFCADQPYTVTALFPDRQRWLFSRELLAEGAMDGAGEGDVVVAPTRDGVEVTLRSPSGEATVLLDADEVADFLAATRRVVPDGHEHLRVPDDVSTLEAS